MTSGSWHADFKPPRFSAGRASIAAERRQLRLLAKQVERALGHKAADTASLILGWSWAKLTLKFNPVAWLRRFDRVQVEAARLTFAPSDARELRKLLVFLGHERSVTALRILEYFAAPRS